MATDRGSDASASVLNDVVNLNTVKVFGIDADRATPATLPGVAGRPITASACEMTVPDCQTAGETSTLKPTKKANATAAARISRKTLLVMRASLRISLSKAFCSRSEPER